MHSTVACVVHVLAGVLSIAPALIPLLCCGADAMVFSLELPRAAALCLCGVAAVDAMRMAASAPGAVQHTAATTFSRSVSIRMEESSVMLDKRSERRRIMSAPNFKRGGTPFDKDIHKDVAEKMSEKFKGELVEQMRQSDLREIVKGEGPRQVTFKLAKEYGFCWGVDRSIELAWAAREAYPGQTMHITNELIHNPAVNEMLEGMDVKFIEKTTEGKRFDTVKEGEVVILPAFGASLDEMQLLDKRGVTIVDTTCPWVSKVWTTVDKYTKADRTSVIHGKWAHEESMATASMCDHYIIVKDMDEAQEIASYIMQEPGALTDEQLLEKYKNAISKGFDPKKHLRRIGIANQTTMYKKETQAIGRLLEKAMVARFGPEEAADNFAAFDTICDATQVRQDAITEMTVGPDADDVDLILVVGGWDSSNTGHLLEIPIHNGKVAYHINKGTCITEDNEITHRLVNGDVETKKDFLPLDRPVRIGVTSGASTPDSVVQEVLERIVLLKSLAPVA